MHFPGAPAYNRAVADVLLFCTTLLLPVLLLPGPLPQPRRGQLVALAVAAGVLAASAALSPNATAAMSRLRVYYSLAAFGSVLFVALRRCRPYVVLQLLVVVAMIHMFFLIIALKAAAASVGQAAVAVPPYFSNVRHFGYQGFLSACAALSLGFLDRRFRAAGLLLGSASLFGIILFGSRGALAAWAIFVTVLAALLRDRRRVVIAAAALSLAGALLASYAADQRHLFNTSSLFDRASVGASLVESPSRLIIWRDAMTAIAARPVLGYGPEAFVTSGCCLRPKPLTHPHNVILQVLLESGFAGLTSLAWVACAYFGQRITTALTLAREEGSHAGSAATLAMLAGFCSFAMVDGLSYHIVPLLHFAVISALFAAASRPAPPA